MIRIAFDETAFRQLVAGQVVAFNTNAAEVQIILSDIGWVPMLRAVLDGMAPGQPKGPPDPPEAREFLPNRRRR
jgi:hypothetical protein